MILIAFIVILFSGLIQGITSFGFSLLAVPLLSIFLSLKLIVPLLVIFSLIMNSIILYKLRKYVNFREIYLLILAAVLATPLGANLLINTDEKILQFAVGVIVVMSALIFKSGFKLKIRNEKIAYIPVGIASGILNGSVSLSGPPVIVFLTNQDKNKQVFRATLTSFFWTLNLITLFVFFKKALITREVISMTGILLPALIIGSAIGISVGNKVKEGTFKNLTISLMAIMGTLSIIGSINLKEIIMNFL